MSLFGSLQLANNALRANQIGLQVVGQNIANANTPGYIREEVVFQPAPTQKQGDLLLGRGVQVTGIVQKIDVFLEERLRGATSERISAETQEQAYQQLEGILAELGDTDLSSSLNNFFNSISEILNQPESTSVRNLAVLQGETLAGDITRIAKRVRQASSDLNNRVVGMADDINRLTREIRDLNIRITTVEGGGSRNSDAVGLRDQRNVALANLSELLEVRVVEQTSGGVAVFSAGEFLVLEGNQRDVKVQTQSENGLAKAEIQLAEIDSPVQTSGGELAGLLAARDDILGGFLGDLDNFAATLAFEFNKVYSGGQGLTGFAEITSEFRPQDATAALDEAGLPFTPVNGSFEVLLRNKQTGVTQTTTVLVDLNGLDDDTSLTDLAATLDAIDGLSASLTPKGALNIKSDSANSEFAFAGDSSGVLAALGVNTFFSGTAAIDLAVNEVVSADPAKFVASAGGIGKDTELAVQLAAFSDRRIASENNATIGELHGRIVSRTTQGSSVARAASEGFRVFEETLRGQQLAVSGVSIDEEAVRMLQFQRSFQASARFIATVSELLDVLVNL